MEVIKERTNFISNYEVLQLLKDKNQENNLKHKPNKTLNTLSNQVDIYIN